MVRCLTAVFLLERKLGCYCKRSIANLAPRGTEQLAKLIASWLRYLQYRPALLDGIVTGTGLLLNGPAP
jgi:hypothetical protein